MSPTRKARLKRHYIGIRPWTRHSMVLLVAGTVYVFVGIVYIGTVAGGPTWTALSFARGWLSLDQWAVVWIVVGVLSVISARWPPVAEKWGYMALTSLATLWGGFYILGVISGRKTFGTLAVGLVWWLVGFLWWAISGLVSPETIGDANGRR